MSGDGDDLSSRGARPVTLSAAILWTIGAAFLPQFIVSITEGARPGAQTDLVNWAVCEVLSYSLLIFAMLRVYTPEASVRDVLGVRPVSPLATALSLAAGATLAPGLMQIDSFIEQRFPYSPEEIEAVDKILGATSLTQRVALLLLLFPLFQELFFRGILFRGLRRGQVEGFGIVASTLLFVLSKAAHDPRGVPTALVLGLFAAWLRGRSGSIVPVILARLAFEAVSVVPDAMGKGDLLLAPRWTVGGAVAAGVCAWGAALVFTRSSAAERGRLLDG